MTANGIAPMGVGGVQHLVERAYRESGAMQFVRELFKNAIEAQATRIEFGPEWQAVEKHGVYRLMVADNGVGMGPEQIETYLNTFGGGGKPIGDAHENFGVGSKTSTLPWNHFGVVVLSWTEDDPDGSMVWLCRDPKTGEYGARQFETEEGDFVNVVVPFDDEETGIDWADIRPEWMKSTGTVVVCLGNTGQEDTFVVKEGGEDAFGVKGVSSYLNKRVWEIPDDVEVHVQELRTNKREDWPTSLLEASHGTLPATGHVDRRWNRRRIRGARFFVKYDRADAAGKPRGSGSVPLKDGTLIEWYLWEGERPKVHSYAHDKGYIAARYDDELYDVKKHHASFRRFGITQSAVRERLTLIARPPKSGDGAFGVYPDTARTSLRVKGSKRAGESLPWDEWGEEFAFKLPKEIVEAIRESLPQTAGTIDDDRWRARLAERFGSRWRRPVLRPTDDGSETVEVSDPGRDRSKAKIKKPKKKRSKPNVPRNLDGPLFDGVKDGSKPASSVQVPGGVPTYRWVGQEDVEESVAAVYQPPTAHEPAGVVLLNMDFSPFVEVIRHWQELYPEHLGDKVRDVVRDVYGQAMVARVAHSQAFVRDPNWGQKRVDTELRTPSALTMAALGLINEDTVISSRLGGELGSRRAASGTSVRAS